MQDRKPHVATRIPQSIVVKIDAVAERLRVDRSTVIRWVLEEMPADFVPKPMKGKK